MNPLKELNKRGQSVWLDFIDREILRTGELARLIAEDGVSGLTSNPTIFEKAISTGADYDADLRGSRGATAEEVFEHLAVADIQKAADLFRPIYEATKGDDGYVSLEVSPRLAYDAEGTVKEALRLFQQTARPNVMIKIPGTREGLAAVRKVVGGGVNVNCTLLFGVKRYEEVVEAYFAGLEDFVRAGGKPSQVASVASFFVSRIDTALDPLIESRIAAAPTETIRAAYRLILGQVAISNAKLAYSRFRILHNGARFKALAAQGARPQRVLFASTSTKNPKYRDVLYAEELVGPQTVDTMPQATLAAFRDHGKVRDSVLEGVDEAKQKLDKLANYQIDLAAVTDKLEQDGVKSFSESFDKLLKVIDSKRKVLA